MKSSLPLSSSFHKSTSQKKGATYHLHVAVTLAASSETLSTVSMWHHDHLFVVVRMRREW
eukprot:scaffold28959_cov160-Skeletonema_menzelii.AAC.3